MAVGRKERLNLSVLHLGSVSLWLKVLPLSHSAAWTSWRGGTGCVFIRKISMSALCKELFE